MSHRITFQPSGLRSDSDDGASILEAAKRAGEGIESVCAGKGVCGKCAVRITSGELSPQTAEELGTLSPAMLAEGYRLSCMAVPLSDCAVEVPYGSRRGRQVVLSGDKSRPVRLDPPVVRYYVDGLHPSHTSPLADRERVRAALGGSHGLDGFSFSLHALRKLPGCLKEGGYGLTLTVRDGAEVIDVRPGYEGRLYGAAIDLGTTTLAGFLCDMETGEVVSTAAMPNPQIPMGEDVMSRITYAASGPEGRDALRRAALDGINSVMRELRSAAPGKPDADDVAHAVVVGNTVMLHLLFGMDTSGIGAFPFTPAHGGPLAVTASESGVEMLGAGLVTAPPVIGGFVGADLVAAAALAGPCEEGETLLVADLGTNGEMALFHPGGVHVCSCATGPAFEGAHIRHGMRAAEGAIERVVVDPDTHEVSLRIIGGRNWSRSGTEARGVCGSGIVDAVAGLLRAGIIDNNGALMRGAPDGRVYTDETGETCFALTDAGQEGVSVCQSDIRAVQLAKAAVAAGVGILLEEAGVAGIDRVLVAGAFGNYIDPASAVEIGMFPGVEPGSVAGIGNAALDGARAMLLDRGFAETARNFALGAELVELSVHPDFEVAFVSSMDFGGR